VAKRVTTEIFFFGLALVIISGCSYPISKALRNQADENLAFTDVLARPSAYSGVVVIWGGVIVKTVSRPGRSELVLWETPLDSRGKPGGNEFSSGLFMAETSEFLDPKKFSGGRKVTVAGKLAGGETGVYNGKPYLYPLVEIKELHLWPERIRWNWGRIPYYWPNQYSPTRRYREPLD
jgi:outer membrane lipoprotein